MSSTRRSFGIRVGVALVVAGVAIWLLLRFVDDRPDLVVDDRDDLVAEVTIEEFADLNDDVRARLRPLIDDPGASSWEPQVLDDRLLVPFGSNPCPRVELTVAAQAGGLVVELEDRPGGCDDMGYHWVAVIELREEPVPDAPIEVIVDVPRGVTRYDVDTGSASQP